MSGSGGGMQMMSGGFETLNMDQMNIVEGGASGFMGFPSAGLASGNGMYSVTLADGNCIELAESCIKQSRRNATKFSVMVDGVKHKIKSHQLTPCVASYSQSCNVSEVV